MSSLSLQELSACLLYSVEHLDRENHLAALEHRQKLTRAWGIPPGASVLEIGPGQGELTVVLGDAVGPKGQVVAIDNAPLNWGLFYFILFLFSLLVSFFFKSSRRSYVFVNAHWY